MAGSDCTASSAIGISHSWTFWYGVAAAQFVAFSVAVAGIFADLLDDDSMPLFIVSGCYVLLMLMNLPLFFFSEGGKRRRPLWNYMALSMVDAFGAFCVLYSLRLTSVTSWTLIGPFGLVTAVPLTMFLFGAVYTWRHLLSGMLGVAGLVVLVLSDAKAADSDEHHSTMDVVLGDLCEMLGYSFYAVSSVLCETFIKSGASMHEVNGFLGLFGTMLALTASFASKEFSTEALSDPVIAIYTFSASVADCVYYSLSAVVLGTAGVAVQEISILGSNLWSILAKIFIIGGFHVNPIVFSLASCMIIMGMALFVLSGDPYKKTADNARSFPEERRSTEAPLLPSIAIPSATASGQATHA